MELEKKTGRGKQVKGGDVFDTVVGTAADAFVHHGISWMAKKFVEMGRYGASELMQNKNLQKKKQNKTVNYGMIKITPLIQDSVGTTLDQLSTKVRPDINIRPIDQNYIEEDLMFTNGLKNSQDQKQVLFLQSINTWGRIILSNNN